MKILLVLLLLSIFAVIKISSGFLILTLIIFLLMLVKPIDNYFSDESPKKSKLMENNDKKNFFDSWPWIILLLIGTIVALHLMYKFQIGTKGMRETAYAGAIGGGIFGGGIYLIYGIWDLIKKRIPKKSLIKNHDEVVDGFQSITSSNMNATDNKIKFSSNSSLKITIIITVAVFGMFLMYHMLFSPQARCVNSIKKTNPNANEAMAEYVCRSK